MNQAKQHALRIRCTSNEKQIGLAFHMWNTDNRDLFPPTAWRTGDYMYQLSWDDYLHSYLGGHDNVDDLQLGLDENSNAIPGVLLCPADRLGVGGLNYGNYRQRRTYAMNYGGPENLTSGQGKAGAHARRWCLHHRSIRNSGALGTPGNTLYKSGDVTENANTIILAEEPNLGNLAGNDWPSFCSGPGSKVPDWTGLQSNPEIVQLYNYVSLLPGGGGQGDKVNFGGQLFGLHDRRFNYLFHDGHVATMRPQDTVGKGTTNAPQGMWTMTRGD